MIRGVEAVVRILKPSRWVAMAGLPAFRGLLDIQSANTNGCCPKIQGLKVIMLVFLEVQTGFVDVVLLKQAQVIRVFIALRVQHA